MGADLEYRVAELERKLSRIIVHGVIAKIDGKEKAVKVKYDDDEEGKDVLTGWLPWAPLRAGPDKLWWMPEEKEQVTILSPSGDMAQGSVLPSLYQDEFPAKADSPDVFRLDFENGSYIRHDKESGDLELVAKGTLWLQGKEVQSNSKKWKYKEFN